jgi:hypothetical protein
MVPYRFGQEEALEKFGAKDFAPGLPLKKDFGDLTKLKPGQQVDFIIQKHEAERAGTHHDVRFGTKDTGLFSWATKKELPEPGKSIALFQQPVHRYEYKEYEGTIEEGYGKGKVSKKDVGQLLITKTSPRSVQFTRTDKRSPERFLLVRPSKDKPWLLKNVTVTKMLPFPKEHYRLVKTPQDLPAGSIAQPKIDGASELIKIVAPDKLEISSFRASKGTGFPLIHTERVFHGKQDLDIPQKYVGSVIRGELYGLRDGKAIPPQELGGILNATIQNSIEAQADKKVKLKSMLYDVRQVGSKKVTELPYTERLDLLREVVKHLPKEKFHLPETATTQDAAEKMLKEIKAGKNPLTREGVVVHAPEAAASSKFKFGVEHDVYIREVFPGEGKYVKDAGGFHYSFTPKGEIVGKVGTGLSDEFRKDLWKNKSYYVGQKARVKAQEQLPSGALRAPVFLALHEG